MAKSKRGRRDIRNIANHKLPTDHLPKTSNIPYGIKNYEDRRQYHPDSFYKTPTTLTETLKFRVPTYTPAQNVNLLKKSKYTPFKTFSPTNEIAFGTPEKTLICIRRNIRKQVLHALNKTGKTGQRRPKWNYNSKISCRR